VIGRYPMTDKGGFFKPNEYTIIYRRNQFAGRLFRDKSRRSLGSVSTHGLSAWLCRKWIRTELQDGTDITIGHSRLARNGVCWRVFKGAQLRVNSRLCHLDQHKLAEIWRARPVHHKTVPVFGNLSGFFLM